MDFIKIIIVVGIILVVLIPSIILLKIYKEKKKNTDYFKEQLHKIIRNEALNKAINNSTEKKDRNFWLLKAVEINQFGEKEHFFNLENEVCVGKDFSSSNLFVLDEDVDFVQCKIGVKKEKPYIINVSGNVPLVFSYKKRHGREIGKNYSMKLNESIGIYTGDIIQFGETKIVLYVYNYNKGIV